ncbi:MAG TPA: flavodoxin domain-containing protein [Terriglobia bacterium]|nr:flavodoxin domain-containing protein [Terriglobia bacterium]
MNTIAILYATREGQTEKIADFLARHIQEHGFRVEIWNLRETREIDPERYSAMVLAASVHAGSHEREMVQYVRAHAAKLHSVPTAFLSVTLSEAGVERPNATAEERARFEADVHKVLEQFYKETGWRPPRVQPVAGALLYSKYNFFVRFIMKRIARKAGAETDTSHDYEYTDWAALEHFAEQFSAEVAAGMKDAG